MARTTATVTSFSTSSADVADPAGTALVPATDGVVSGYPLEEIVLRVSTGEDATTVTVIAGDSPPALSAGQGDEVVAMTSASAVFIGPFESARFAQSNGNLHVDVSTTATVSAFHMPRNF